MFYGIDMASENSTVRQKVAHQLVRWRHHSTDMLNRTRNKHLKIGVTGFSGSGKSTFITSLVHQLKHAQNASLGGFLPARDGRLLQVELTPIPGIPLFDYEAGIAALAASPAKWPDSTQHISGTRLAIAFKQHTIWQSLIGETRQLTLDIRDYPGEWLLDIPMLSMSFREWSIDLAALAESGLRQQLGNKLIADMQALSPLDPFDESLIEGLFSRYRSFLQDCKGTGLTLIQPGRVLLPDSTPFKAFLPLFNLHHYPETALKAAAENSLYKMMQRRYQAYLDEIAAPFFNAFFRGIDRQVILIDVIKALSGGKERFDDMMMAFSRIIDSYHIGHNSLLSRLMMPRVEKILFLASKPDRILMQQHESLRHFTDALISRICPQSVRNMIQIETEIAAAVRSSEDHSEYLTGQLLDGRYGELRHPPIPEKIPSGLQWQTYENWHPPVLQPPHNPNLMFGGRLSHIRMDKILRDLVGDKFQ